MTVGNGNSYALTYGLSDGELIMKERKIKNGEYITKWPNGKKAVIAHYKDDRLDGEYKAFHKTGQLAWRVNYVAGKMQGEADEYDEDGKKLHSCFYHNGQCGNIKFYGKH